MNTQVKLNRLFGFAEDAIIIPSTRIRTEWNNESMHGFLSAITQYGLSHHKMRLNEILVSNSPDRMTEVEDFIDFCFNYYIAAFKQHAGSNCYTPTPFRSNYVHDINDSLVQELSDSQFQKSVHERDGVCLFCWDNLECHAAHIVAENDLPFEYDEQSIFQLTGLHSKHQVQNGLLLCSNCHGQFEKLKRYVDVVEENGDVKYVLKFVKGQSECNEEEWRWMVHDIRVDREKRHTRFAERFPTDDEGNMSLWFLSPTANVESDRQARSKHVLEPEDLRPNIKALEFHKTACLIWRMAGGAEEDEEYCSDYDSDVGQENITYDQRTDEFVSATAASLTENLSVAAFRQSLRQHPDLVSPKSNHSILPSIL